MKVFISCCLVLVVIMAGTPAQALEPWVPYDNFNGTPMEFFLGKPIDPDKWRSGGYGEADILDCIREIRWNRLHILNRTYNFSGYTNTSVRLDFPYPEKVTAIRAAVMIKDSELTPCPRNRVRGGRLGGYFFNTGEVPDPEGNQGDVLAAIQVQQNWNDPPDVFHVYANVFNCLYDPGCFNTADVCPTIDLGTVGLNERTRLSIQWDKETDQFIFKRDGNEVYCVYDAALDQGPPNSPEKRIDVSHRVFAENCTDDPYAVASMEVLIDNVFVNESALSAP